MAFPHSLIFPLKLATHADIYEGAYNSCKKLDISGMIQLTWMRNACRRNGVEKFSWQTNLQNLFENGKNNLFFFPLADFTAYHIQGQLGVVSNFISLLELNLDLHVGFVPVTCLEMCFKEIKSKSTQSKISVLTPDHQEYLHW